MGCSIDRRPTNSSMPSHPIRVLSVIPPMTQLNTPYPSTAYLTGFLRSRGVEAVQEDLALALVLNLFSAEGLLAIRACSETMPKRKRSADRSDFPPVRALSLDDHADHRFLQGRDPTLAHRIASRHFLPEGPRFKPARRVSSTTTATIRWPGPSARWACKTALATSPRCTSTTSPTCCATPSTRVSSLSAMPNHWRTASRLRSAGRGAGRAAEPGRRDAARR